MNILRRFAASDSNDNLSSRFRKKRFKLFQKYLEKLELKKPKIIDIGGTNNYWKQINNYFNSEFLPVIINISIDNLSGENYIGIVGDGKSLSFIKDNTFDVAYSNSVIEHLKSFEQQYEMAKNIKRVAKKYYIQTPAFIFPFEPHFLFPFFHWLPKRIRIWLVLNFNLGWFEKCQNKIDAALLVNSIRILKKRELEILFDDATFIKEKFFMMTKSYLITNII